MPGICILGNDDNSFERGTKANNLLAYLHQPRETLLWMRPRLLIWFDMVDQQHNDELWYADFQVTKRALL